MPPSSPPPTDTGAATGPAGARLAWIDNLRTVTIALVVNMHACVTYSHIGDWYRMEAPEPGTPAKIVFFLWQGHLQAFFMGLLFFLAGVFAHSSLERRGPTAFLRERGRRLGLPSLFYMVVLHPFIVYVLLGDPLAPDRPSLAALYGRYLTSTRVLRGNGPMWFALALLAFSAVLAGVRNWRSISPGPGQPAPAAPGIRAIVGFGAGLVLSTFAVRLVQPLGTNVLNFQLCFFAQYVAAFIVGVVAGRGGWLVPLARSPVARRAGWFGLVGGPLVVVAIFAALGVPESGDGANRYGGGWTLEAACCAAWEQTAGLCLALGCLGWAQRYLNLRRPWTTWLSERAFGVYLFHAPVLVALTPVIRPLVVHAFVGVALLTGIGLATSFLVADLARRLPGLRAIL